MSSKKNKALNKLKKFQRDPSLFFYDFFRKRVRDDLAAAPIGTALHVDFDTDSVDVIDNAVVITDREVVQTMKALKAGKTGKVTISWWK